MMVMEKCIFKKITSLFLILAILTAFSSCAFADGTKKDSDTSDESDTSAYRIAVCRSYESPVYDTIVKGFADSLYDNFGEAHIVLSDRTFPEDANGEAVVLSMLSEDNELVFAVGSPALHSASAATTTTPIVGAGIINYKNTLHLFSNDDSQNNLSGRNVTGISSAPYFPAQLSLLIEATPDLKTVGILYSPIDENAIYQNEILEFYLDQAGIPWKEYEITETKEALKSEAYSTQPEIPTVILPSTVIAASGKEGSNIDVESLGEEGTLTGINSPESTRTAKTSKTWTGGKLEMIAAEKEILASANVGTNGTDTADSSDDINKAQNTSDTEAPSDDEAASAPDNSVADNMQNPDDVHEPPEKIVARACDECSVLYISAESMLSDQIDMITQTATAKGVSTIGGDINLGKKTLACIYTDPYDQGYKAGKMAYRILVGGENASDIKISKQSHDNLQKLYQDSSAKALNISFPKSFSDVDEFLTTYVPGTYTKRTTKKAETAK